MILTVLGGAEDGRFIPSQIGMEDLQESAGWELDFEDEDHIWHEFDGFHSVPDNATFESVAHFVAACRAALAAGWDDDAAMTRHLS